MADISRYLEHLPALFQQDGDFLGRFLLAFEHVLSGVGDPLQPGLEEIAAGLYRFFDPSADFGAAGERDRLEWLAGWVALSLRADLDDLQRRDLIARTASLYPLRGTKQGLEKLISIYTRLGATVLELNTPFQIGVHSTIGEDALLDGGAPHFFRLKVRVPETDPQKIRHYRELITAILDQEKPAHTHYLLEKSDFETPPMQIGEHSTVGVDTLLSPAQS